MLDEHESYVYPVTLSPDAKLLASGAWDHTVRIWDVASGAELIVLRDHQAPVFDISFDSSGSRLVSVSNDGQVLVWDTSTFAKLKTIELGPATGFAASFSRDDSLLVIASGGLRVFDGTTFELLKKLHDECDSHLEPEHAAGIVFSPDGTEFISYSGKLCHEPGPWLSTWSAETLQLQQRVRMPYESATTVAYSPSGSEIAVGHEWGQVSIWQRGEFDEPLAELGGHAEEVFDVRYLPDGSRIVTTGRDGTIRLWDSETHRAMGVLRGHDDYVFSLAVDPRGRRFLSGSGDGTIRIWETSPLTQRLRNAIDAQGRRATVEQMAESLTNDHSTPEAALWQIEQMSDISLTVRRELKFAVLRRLQNLE